MKRNDLLPYYRSFFQGNLRDFVLGLLASLTGSACTVGVAWLIQQLLDACTGSTGALPFRQLLALSAGLLILYLGSIQLGRVTTSRFVPRAMAQYKSFLFGKISRKSIAAFRLENTATYLSAISNDTKTIQMGLGDLFNGCSCLLRMLFAVGLMLWYSPTMTLGAVAISLFFFLLSIPTSRKLVQAEQELSDCSEGVTARFKDFLTGFPVVKSFQAEKEMAVLFEKDVKSSENADKKRRMADLMFDLTIDGGLAAARILILLTGVWMAMQGSGVSAGMVIAFVQLLDHVVSPVQELPLQLADLEAADALIRKAAENLEKNIREEGTEAAPALEQGIKLKNLSFSYEPGRPVLRNISHCFEAGKRYALVGGSGCGKSTLLHLLMGGSAYEGQILFDRSELQGIPCQTLYASVSLISQNVFLFNATILENITMFRTFPQEEIQRAVSLSGLLPVIREKGENFLCGENGCNLSGGEKQRISIARSLLRKSKLLLVDEATSALDAETAAQVTQSLLNLKGITEIVVTHSLEGELLRQYDEIIAMKAGRLEEIGSFETLMEKKEYFYSLYTVSR